MTRRKITSARCRCEFDVLTDGSILQDTAQAHVIEFRTHLSVESPEADADIERVLRLAKRTCFAEQLVRHPVPLKSSYQINGQPRELQFDQ